VPQKSWIQNYHSNESDWVWDKNWWSGIRKWTQRTDAPRSYSVYGLVLFLFLFPVPNIQHSPQISSFCPVIRRRYIVFHSTRVNVMDNEWPTAWVINDCVGQANMLLCMSVQRPGQAGPIRRGTQGFSLDVGCLSEGGYMYRSRSYRNRRGQ